MIRSIHRFLVDNVRPTSPADDNREKYRRTGGHDKQGDVGAGNSRPEFVSFTC